MYTLNPCFYKKYAIKYILVLVFLYFHYFNQFSYTYLYPIVVIIWKRPNINNISKDFFLLVISKQKNLENLQTFSENV